MEHPEPGELTNKSVDVIEPYSWAWLAEKAAGGVVAYAAGKVLESIFGSEGLRAADIQRMIDAAVDEIKRHITASLVAQTRQEAETDVSACYSLLQQYANNQSHVDRLYHADLAATHAMATLEASGPPGLTSFTSAANLKLLCVAAIFKIRETAGELTNYEAIANDAADHIRETYRPVAASLHARANGVGPVSVRRVIGDEKLSEPPERGDPPHTDHQPITRYVAYYYDGGQRRSFKDRSSDRAENQAREDRARRIAAYRTAETRFEANVIAPSERIIANWAQALELLRQATP